MRVRVEADAHTLMRQAWMTADDYMRNAAECIDTLFGDGYAEKHPELIGIFMQTAARDFHTAMMKAGMDGIADAAFGVRDDD